MPDKKAIVIGGGLGGLAAALRLSAAGWRVTLCEQSASLGGKMNERRSEGFRFDTGPSLVTMPWIFEELFETLGLRLRDHLELTPLRPLARYAFADGTTFDYTTEMPAWFDTIRRLEPADVDGFLRYMRLGARLYELSRGTFLRRPMTDPPDGVALAAMTHFPLRHAWGNYDETVRHHFHDPRLRQLFNRYPTYVGSSPYRCPATLTLIPFIEYAFGGWYVQGGLYRMIECLAEIAGQRGVEIRLESPVTAIEHRMRRITGVQLASGIGLPAHAVVLNGDASTAPILLGETTNALPIAERSLSGLVFLIGVGRKLPELHHHNVYFSADYPAEFGQLFDDRVFPDDPTVYVNVPSRSDPTCAPKSGETLFVMANAPASDLPWDDHTVTYARGCVMERLRSNGFPDIESDIVTEQVITPQHMAARYGMPGGAIYGRHSHGWRRAFWRQPNRDGYYKGLYYVGGGSHPGGGTPIVLLSAQIVTELMQRYEAN